MFHFSVALIQPQWNKHEFTWKQMREHGGRKDQRIKDKLVGKEETLPLAVEGVFAQFTHVNKDTGKKNTVEGKFLFLHPRQKNRNSMCT